MTTKLPDELYVFRLYTSVGVFRILSECSTEEAFRTEVVALRKKKLDTFMKYAVLSEGSNETSHLTIDAHQIYGWAHAEGSPYRPNVKAMRQQAHAQAQRPPQHGGRVTIGQVATAPAGNKKQR